MFFPTPVASGSACHSRPKDAEPSPEQLTDREPRVADPNGEHEDSEDASDCSLRQARLQPRSDVATE